MAPKILRSMYNKTIVRFGFCDIQKNQGLSKGYQPQTSASADKPYLTMLTLYIEHGLSGRGKICKTPNVE